MQPQPQSVARPSIIRRALFRVSRLLVSTMKVVFIILLLVIPVPVAVLFTSIFKTRRTSDSAQVLKKE